MFRVGLAVLAVLAVAEPASATLSPPITAPKITASSNAPMLEGQSRELKITHTCKAAQCETLIWAAGVTARARSDYRFPAAKNYRYARGQRLTVNVNAVAIKDSIGEPREQFTVLADLDAKDGARVQRARGKKSMYILDSIPSEPFKPRITSTRDTPLVEGFRRNHSVTANACRAATCEITISVRNVSVTPQDYRVPFTTAVRSVYKRGEPFSFDFALAALADGIAEPEEKLTISAVLILKEGTSEQRYETLKTVSIVDPPPAPTP